jgi:hypothetical protein
MSTALNLSGVTSEISTVAVFIVMGPKDVLRVIRMYVV